MKNRLLKSKATAQIIRQTTIYSSCSCVGASKRSIAPSCPGFCGTVLCKKLCNLSWDYWIALLTTAQLQIVFFSSSRVMKKRKECHFEREGIWRRSPLLCNLDFFTSSVLEQKKRKTEGKKKKEWSEPFFEASCLDICRHPLVIYVIGLKSDSQLKMQNRTRGRGAGVSTFFFVLSLSFLFSFPYWKFIALHDEEDDETGGNLGPSNRREP